jgi:hypothetical protein
MKITFYYKCLANILILFVLFVVGSSHVRAAELDIKPCYECTNCVIDPVTLEPVPPEGEDANWVPCSDPPAINLCSKGLTVVGVLDFGFEIVDSTEATFLEATSLRYSVEDIDHDGAEDDLVYFFKTKDLISDDGTLEVCLEITNLTNTTLCDTVVLFSKGRCE